MDSDVFTVRNVHVHQKFLYLLTMVTLNDEDFVLILVVFLLLFLSLLLALLALLENPAVGLEVLN